MVFHVLHTLLHFVAKISTFLMCLLRSHNRHVHDFAYSIALCVRNVSFCLMIVNIVFHVLHTLLHFAQEHRQNRRSVCLSRIPQCWKRQTLLHFAGQASARRRRVCLSRIPQCWKRQTLLYFGAGVRENIASVCLFKIAEFLIMKNTNTPQLFWWSNKKVWSVCLFSKRQTLAMFPRTPAPKYRSVCLFQHCGILERQTLRRLALA